MRVALVEAAVVVTLLAACNAVVGNERRGLDDLPDAAAAPVTADAATSCANDCDGEPIGTARCAAAAGMVEACVRDASGCPAWRSQACASGQCDPANAGACAGACPEPCPQEGAVTCDGTTAKRVCVLTGVCLGWSDRESCPSSQSCFGAECTTTCVPDAACTAAGVKVCASSGTFRVCAEAAPGCLRLGTPQACASGETCGGAGICTCNGCTAAGKCFPGTTKAACGKSGACGTCTTEQECNGGECKLAPVCQYGGEQFSPNELIKIGQLCYRWNGNGTTPFGTCQQNIPTVPCP